MKLGLAARASAIALSTVAFTNTAHAQSAVDTLRDVILVTGTKKANAEDVQDVPLAVTAYGDAQIDALKVRDLQSLTYSIPNVSLDDIGTSRGGANFTIRGIGINSSIPSIDPTVGVFVDGMYLGINAGVVFDLFDLESIEVLRGPQGILFGRNVTGGAVLINTKRPGDQFEANFKGAVESGLRSTGYNYYAMGSVGGPISDTLAAKVAVYYNKDEGWHRRYLGGPLPYAVATAAFTAAGAAVVSPDGPAEDAFADFGEAETFLIRPSVYWTPNDNFEAIIRYEHGESEGDGPAAQNHTNGSGISNIFFSAPRDDFDFSIDEPGFYDNQWDQITAELNLDVAFGDGTITNIFGWRQYSGATSGDIDATPLFLFHSGTTLDHEQLSNELRYNGRFLEKAEITAGFYYFTQDLAYSENRNIPPQLLVGASPYFSGGGVQDQSTIGLFGQIDYSLTDRLTATLGGRWTREEKDVVISNLLLTRSFPFCDVQVSGSCSEDFSDGNSWNNFTAKAGLEYVVTDDINLYGHWTQGVRSGGYNFRNTSFAFNPGPFDEEKVNAYEVGLKAQPAEGRATFNAAFFVNDVSDMQREINLADPISGVVQIIRNTADATIWGFEIESQFAVTDNLLLRGSIGHTDGDYNTVLFDISGDGVIDDADLDLEIPRLAPYTYSLGFVYSRDLGSMGTAGARFNYSHRDLSYYTDNNLGFLNAVDSIDGSIALTTFSDRATISLYGKNLLNEVQFGGDTQLPSSLGGGTFSPLAKGRVVGLELRLATN